MAGFGAVLGPVALAWGLQHTSGTGASLMLTMEALFTALLARWLYQETMDRRVAAAMGLLLAGGALLVLDQGRGGAGGWLGLLAVLLATAAWGMDNTLSRALAERDPGQVVLAKATLGAGTTALLATLAGEPVPGAAAALGLLAWAVASCWPAWCCTWPNRMAMNTSTRTWCTNMRTATTTATTTMAMATCRARCPPGRTATRTTTLRCATRTRMCRTRTTRIATERRRTRTAHR